MHIGIGAGVLPQQRPGEGHPGSGHAPSPGFTTTVCPVMAFPRKAGEDHGCD